MIARPLNNRPGLIVDGFHPTPGLIRECALESDFRPVGV